MKHLIGLFVLALVLVWSLGQILPSSVGYASVLKHVGVQPAIEAQAVDVGPSFRRGHTVKQDQPCWNEHTKGHYESDLITKGETIHWLTKAGADINNANILAAISHAESGSQLNCYGDDSDEYYGDPTSDGRHYGESYGIFQIRTIVEAKGTGECRDMERLQAIEQQAICAWEISGKGKVYSPTWSMHTNGRYRQWLNVGW